MPAPRDSAPPDEPLGLIPRANLYLLLMQAPAAVCVLRGPEHVLELANPVFQRLLGSRDVLGRPIRELLAQLDSRPLLEALERVLQKDESFAGQELSLPIQREDGTSEERTFTFVYQPMHGLDGRIEGVVLFGFDITEQIDARRKLEQLTEELRQVDRAKDEFIAIISHELRTPMTSILGWTRMLGLGGLDEETQRSALESLERSTRAQAKLIEDLLDESRIAAGKLRLDLRTVDLAGIVESAVTMVRPAADVKRLEVSLDVAPDRFDVFADPARLQQVVGNVLGNAIKFTPEGGSVSVAVSREDGSARIAVTDTGRGIDPSLLPYVFERFRQGEGSGADRQGGLGLGLAIARHLVEMHGGTVEASSEGKGKGTTLTIRLPLRESEATASFIGRDPARTAALPRLNGVRVLIIEDEVDNRNVLAAALKKCGAEVQCAGSALEGFDLFSRWNPHVVVCDIQLPDLDGCDVIKQLRERGWQTPALALTVLGRAGEQARIAAAGFDVFRQKPIDPVDLAHEVARLAHSQEVPAP